MPFIHFASAFKVFDRPYFHFVKTDQINALASHDIGGALTKQANHPRATHLLLRHINTRSSLAPAII